MRLLLDTHVFNHYGVLRMTAAYLKQLRQRYLKQTVYTLVARLSGN